VSYEGATTFRFECGVDGFRELRPARES